MFPNDPQRDIDFWNLWESDRKLFFRKCLKLMNGDVCEAEDALSDAMLKAREKMVHYRDRIQNFKGWALRLTENVCLDQRRKHRRLVSYDEIPDSLAHQKFDPGLFFMESKEQYHSRERLFEGIFAFVHELPRRLREPALLRFLYSVSYHDIAGRLHITEENARKRVQEVRSALKFKYGGSIGALLASFPGEVGMEAESPVVKRLRDETRSALDTCGSELELSYVTAWIVAALPINGSDGEILVFLPFDPSRYQKGFESFMNYLSRHPSGWKRHLELAQLLCAAGIWNESEKEFRRVLMKHPRSVSAWISLGNMLMEAGRVDEAEGLFQQGGAFVYRVSSREYLNGMAAMCRGNRDEAIKFFERASALEPSNALFRQAMGVCLFKAERYLEALRHFEEILAGSPGDIVSLVYCCEVSIRLNRMKEAGRYVDIILAGNPNDYFALTRKAALKGRRGASGKAELERLQRIAGWFDRLARIMKEPEKEKFTDHIQQTSSR